MPSPCAPVPQAPPVDTSDDYGRPVRGCGLAGVREVAGYLGLPSKSFPKTTTTPAAASSATTSLGR
jgi:hypothetical protein